MHLSCSAVADNTHQDPFPDIHSGSSGDPLTRDCPIYVQSVFRWRLLDFLRCSATSLSEGWAHFVLIPFSRTVEPELEIILITQDEGDDCDLRWFALDFWTKSLCSKDRFFFILFLYKQYETNCELPFRGESGTFHAETGALCSILGLKTIWTNHKYTSNEILGWKSLKWELWSRFLWCALQIYPAVWIFTCQLFLHRRMKHLIPLLLQTPSFCSSSVFLRAFSWGCRMWKSAFWTHLLETQKALKTSPLLDCK